MCIRDSSETYPGKSVVYVDLRDDTKAADVPGIWVKVRNMMADIRGDFPSEFKGFSFNDSFGDVYGNIYAFTSDGFSPREVKDWAETVQSQVLQLKDVGKVDLIGTRDEVIYIEFSARKLAALGLDQKQVLDTLSLIHI